MGLDDLVLNVKIVWGSTERSYSFKLFTKTCVDGWVRGCNGSGKVGLFPSSSSGFLGLYFNSDLVYSFCNLNRV